MFTLRCTRKLLGRLEQSEETAAPTTVLGDWYANLLYARPRQLVLCISERSLLPVVLEAKPAKTLAPRLALGVGEMLQRFGIAPELIEKEQAAMGAFAYGRTSSRQVLGSLNDLMFMLSCYVHDAPAESLLEQSIQLAQTPCKPIGYDSPEEATFNLFRIK